VLTPPQQFHTGCSIQAVKSSIQAVKSPRAPAPAKASPVLPALAIFSAADAGSSLSSTTSVRMTSRLGPYGNAVRKGYSRGKVRAEDRFRGRCGATGRTGSSQKRSARIARKAVEDFVAWATCSRGPQTVVRLRLAATRAATAAGQT
jgi:hypothetical protein